MAVYVLDNGVRLPGALPLKYETASNVAYNMATDEMHAVALLRCWSM